MGFYDNGAAPSGDVVEGGTEFYSGGPAYTAIDPVAIQNFTKQAADSAAASEVSNKASKAQADASAASAAASHTSELNAAASDADAVAKAGVATTQAGIATTKAGESATSAAAALASKNAAKTSEDNAKTSETNAATSASQALASKNAAGTSETNAATSASQALASKNAAGTSETNAAASATAANTSKVNAGTSETNAAASAAAALASKNAAATSETNAAGSATAAAGSASTASTQAGNASTSATNAASSLTSFRNVWCGTSATDPTLNGNGGALTTGCLYFSTTAGNLKIYNGTAWVNYSAVSVVTIFGRSGTVTAQSGDYTFAQIGSKPTSLNGYGITDAPPGQCKLSYVSATQISLKPFNGNALKINGVVQSVPSGGVPYTISGLIASTLYYVYAWMNGGTMTLEVSATGHTTSTTAGNVGTEIKSGDDTRSLVGMFYTSSSTQFVDSTTTRAVRSWFNDNGVAGSVSGGSVVSTTSTTNVELDTAMRCFALCWANEFYSAQNVSQNFANTASNIAYNFIALNGVQAGNAGIGWSTNANGQAQGVSVAAGQIGADSLQTFTMLMASSNASVTANFASRGVAFSTMRR